MIVRWVEQLHYDSHNKTRTSHCNMDVLPRISYPADCFHYNQIEAKSIVVPRTSNWSAEEISENEVEDQELKFWTGRRLLSSALSSVRNETA